MSDRIAPSALAARMLDAHDRAALTALPSAQDAAFTLEDAYRVADINRKARVARGERVLGYKIGFTNRSIWERYRVHQPIWGPVWDGSVRLLDGARASVSLRGLVQPRLEPEVVFGFARAPRAGMSEAELRGCIEWTAHGIEIVHTHYADWRFGSAADTVADFALHGALLVGPRVPIARFDDARADLAALRMRLLRDGTLVDEGEGTLVLDGPLTALRLWADAMLAQPQGWRIEAGDVVTTGTLTDAWPLVSGQCWQTEPSDARLAGLTLHIEP